MQYEEILKKVEECIEKKQFIELKKLIPDHPEDISQLISHISSPSWKIFIFRMITHDKAIQVFEYLPGDEQEDILKSLSSHEIQNILNDMSPDDRTELFEEMPAELVKRCMNLLSVEERRVALDMLNYPESSVGRLMTPDFVQLYEDMTAREALVSIREVGLKRETIYHCYILGRDKKLNGVCSLKKLVLANPEVKISELMFKEIIKVNVNTDKEIAANTFKDYDLIALPVVDNSNRLLGIVTFDDFVDVLEDEATEDFERIAAVLPVVKPYTEANILDIVWKRGFWLVLLLIFESVSIIVMQSYLHVIQQLAAVTFFIPILIAMGGNTGTQSATLVIRSLATGDIKIKDFIKVIARESLIGVSIGTILALVGSLIVAYLQKNMLLSVAVSVSMGITIFLATIVGASLPIVFQKLKLDPALMSGPLIATIVDVVGILVYFKIATMILGL